MLLVPVSCAKAPAPPAPMPAPAPAPAPAPVPTNSELDSMVAEVERQISDSTYNDVGTEGAGCAPGGNLQIGRDNVMDFHVGLRFQNITIPQGNIVTQAYLKVYKTHIDWAGTCTTRIYLYDADDVDQPSNCDLIRDTGNFTSEYKEFTVSDDDWAPLNDWYQTPDFKSVVQEVINRLGWSPGNNMYIVWRRTALAGNHGFSGYPNGNEAILYVEHQEARSIIEAKD